MPNDDDNDNDKKDGEADNEGLMDDGDPDWGLDELEDAHADFYSAADPAGITSSFGVITQQLDRLSARAKAAFARMIEERETIFRDLYTLFLSIGYDAYTLEEADHVFRLPERISGKSDNIEYRVAQIVRSVIPIDPDGTWRTADHYTAAIYMAFEHKVPPETIRTVQLDWMAAEYRRLHGNPKASKGDDTRRQDRPIHLTIHPRVRRHLARFPNQHEVSFRSKQRASAGNILRFELFDISPGIDLIETEAWRAWGEHPIPGAEPLDLKPRRQEPQATSTNPRVRQILKDANRPKIRKK